MRVCNENFCKGGNEITEIYYYIVKEIYYYIVKEVDVPFRPPELYVNIDSKLICGAFLPFNVT